MQGQRFVQIATGHIRGEFLKPFKRRDHNLFQGHKTHADQDQDGKGAEQHHEIAFCIGQRFDLVRVHGKSQNPVPARDARPRDQLLGAAARLETFPFWRVAHRRNAWFPGDVFEQKLPVGMAHHNAFGRQNEGMARLAQVNRLNVIGEQSIQGVGHADAAQHFAGRVKDRGTDADNQLSCGNAFRGNGTVAFFSGERVNYILAAGNIIGFCRFALDHEKDLFSLSIEHIKRVHIS